MAKKPTQAKAAAAAPLAAATWRNRIVGHGERPASSFHANPANARSHPKAQQAAIAGTLGELGWIQDVIVNKTTGNVVDGHARIAEALRLGSETPVPYKEVELTLAEERLALATLDPIGAMAIYDQNQLDALLRQVNTGDEALQSMLSELASDNGLDYAGGGAGPGNGPSVEYTKKIEAPIYKPTGPKPKLTDLYDTAKTDELTKAIDASSLPEAEKRFLRIAAQRHTVLDFRAIAEYYAHSEAPMQALMEDSALIIIDFQRAIELGYVKLSSDIAFLYDDEHAQAD